MGHQITMKPELPIMDWLLSHPPSHKVECTQQHSIIEWWWYIRGWAQAVPESTVKLYKVAQVPMVPIPDALPSLSYIP